MVTFYPSFIWTVSDLSEKILYSENYPNGSYIHTQGTEKGVGMGGGH